MTDRELMQMALDALEKHVLEYETAEALRARLAQPEQEPVAWITGDGKGELWWHQSVKFDDDGNLIGENPDDIPLYTAPPQRQWVGLTDSVIQTLIETAIEGHASTRDSMRWLYRVIEAKLKEKNNG